MQSYIIKIFIEIFIAFVIIYLDDSRIYIKNMIQKHIKTI